MSQLKLSDFDISEVTGFIPPNPPLSGFSHDRFKQWEDLAENTPKFVKEKKLRDEVGCATTED